MIRLAKPEDIAAVAEIYDEIHTQEAQGSMTIGWIPGVYPTETTSEAALRRGDLYVYEEEGKILASAVINQVQVDVYAKGSWKYPAEDREVLVLHTLTVSPAAGKKGIGKSFVAFYEQCARDCGCSVLRMDTNARNKVARSFYQKLGYREAGIVPCTFNGIPNVDLVLLEKKL